MTITAPRTEITESDKHRYPQFQYSHLTHELYIVQLDHVNRLVIVGDPNNGCYEWMIRANDRIEQYSDLGYGESAIAMRDGLIAFYGLPEN